MTELAHGDKWTVTGLGLIITAQLTSGENSFAGFNLGSTIDVVRATLLTACVVVYLLLFQLRVLYKLNRAGATRPNMAWLRLVDRIGLIVFALCMLGLLAEFHGPA